MSTEHSVLFTRTVNTITHLNISSVFATN